MNVPKILDYTSLGALFLVTVGGAVGTFAASDGLSKVATASFFLVALGSGLRLWVTQATGGAAKDPSKS